MNEITTVHASTIPDAWFQLLFYLQDKGYKVGIDSGSFEKEQYRLQYPGVAVSIAFPDKDMYNFIPEGSSIAPPTSRDYVEHDYFPNYLMRGELQENETYTYGSRINKKLKAGRGVIAGGKPQIDFVIDMLRKTPLTNQAVIAIESPDDLVECYGNDGKLDPPCLRLIDFKVIPVKRSDENLSSPFQGDIIPEIKTDLVLTMSVYFRSWDLWAGFPSNLCGLELLKQYVASECDLINGAMFAYSAGLHLYGYQEEIAKLRLHRS